MSARFSQNEQQALLSDTLERYLRDAYSLPQRAAALATDEGFSRDHWAFFAETGLLGLPFEAADGGFDGSLSDVMQVLRVFGQHLVVEPYVPCILLAGKLLAQSTDDGLKQRWLEPLIAGESLLGLAHFERGQSSAGLPAATRLTQQGGHYLINGSKLLVPVPNALDGMLVTARDEHGKLQICIVPPSAAGVAVRSYRTVDGHLVGDVKFDAVAVAPEAIVPFANGEAALAEVIDYATAGLCAEAIGCMRAVTDLTVEYARNRKQFGRAIGSFQVIKHRLVDCEIACRQAESMLDWASLNEQPGWTAYLAAGKAFICEQAMSVGHESIQIHGAIGMTDEYAASHYHKRMLMISMLFGDRDVFVDRYIGCSAFRRPEATRSALPFGALISGRELDFRNEVRAFLAQNLNPEIRLAVRRQTGTYAEKDTVVAWQNILNDKGWLAIHWPVEFGGTGWSPIQRFIFEYECAVAGAPEQVPMGLRYVGPVIARFGSEWQKSYFLPKILSSEHYWAQGFSEPGAGSDLAALKTTAVLEGDHYVVNGSKMWTTHAHYADWLFCIARTEKTKKPQDGVSFLLIDMNSPGISVHPIPLLAVDVEVNQVFLDNVKVPVSHLVGEAGRGWEYTKFLLEFERGGGVFCGRMRHEFNLVKELIDETNPALWNDRVIAHRLAAIEFRLMALEMLELRQTSALQAGQPPGVGGSIAKLLGSELQKDITEAGMRLAGLAGMEMIPQRPLPDPESIGFAGVDLELVAVSRYLNIRAASIYGGSSEIQREIIAKQVLGLR